MDLSLVDGRTLAPDDSEGIAALLAANMDAGKSLAQGILVGATSFSDGMKEKRANEVREAQIAAQQEMAQAEFAREGERLALADARYQDEQARQTSLDALNMANIQSQIAERGKKNPRYMTPDMEGYVPGKLIDGGEDISTPPTGLLGGVTPDMVVGADPTLPVDDVVPASAPAGVQVGARPGEMSDFEAPPSAVIGVPPLAGTEAPPTQTQASAPAPLASSAAPTSGSPQGAQFVNDGGGLGRFLFPDGSYQIVQMDPTKPSGWSAVGSLVKAEKGSEKQSAFDKATETKTVDEITNNQANIPKRRNALVAIQQLLDLGLPTGPVAGRFDAGYQFLDPKLATQRQEFTAYANEIAKTFRTPGEGAMSDRDLLILQQSGPLLTNTEEANRNIISRLLAAADAMDQRDAYIMDQEAKGIPVKVALKKAMDYAQANPVFERDDKGNITNANRISIYDWENKEASLGKASESSKPTTKAEYNNQLNKIREDIKGLSPDSKEYKDLMDKARSLILKRNSSS